MLLATPLARALHEAGHTADWLVARGTESMLEGQPFAHQVFTVGASLPWRAQWRLARELWGRYDIAFVLTASDRPMALARAASANIHALIPARGWPYAWKRRLARRWIPYEDAEHMVWRAIRLGRMAGLSPPARAGLDWSAEDEATVRRALPWPGSDTFVHIHPFARWRYKWWPDTHWRALIRHIADAGLKVAVTAAPGEGKRAARLLDDLDAASACVMEGTLNWRQLACLSRLAAGFVGLDTANTHLAAGADARVVAIFGPTDPRLWGPWPADFEGQAPWRAAAPSGMQRCGNVSLLQGTQSCIPCQLEGCERRPDSDSRCLASIMSETVWRELQWRLEQPA